MILPFVFITTYILCFYNLFYMVICLYMNILIFEDGMPIFFGRDLDGQKLPKFLPKPRHQ